MGIFKCKHNQYRVIYCDRKATKYEVACIKCGYQWSIMKAVGEEYAVNQVIKRG